MVDVLEYPMAVPMDLMWVVLKELRLADCLVEKKGMQLVASMAGTSDD